MDWTYGLLLILSAVVGALTGVFGQSFKEWFMRPRLDFEILAEGGTSDGVIFKIFLVLYNKGRSTSRDTRISFKVIHKDGYIDPDLRINKSYEINPGDCIYFEMGKNTKVPSLDGVKLGGDTD